VIQWSCDLLCSWPTRVSCEAWPIACSAIASPSYTRQMARRATIAITGNVTTSRCRLSRLMVRWSRVARDCAWGDRRRRPPPPPSLVLCSSPGVLSNSLVYAVEAWCGLPGAGEEKQNIAATLHRNILTWQQTDVEEFGISRINVWCRHDWKYGSYIETIGSSSKACTVRSHGDGIDLTNIGSWAFREVSELAVRWF